MSDISSYVLICTYNGELFLNDQVNSIFNQTTPVCKLFIYDFGSTDKTTKLICELQSKFTDRIIVNHFKKTNDVIQSFLLAINDISNKISTNSILYICDQDDYWLPYKNESIIKLQLEKYKYPVMAHHDVILTDKHLKPLEKEFYSINQKKLLNANIPHREFFSTVIGHTICLNYQCTLYLTTKTFHKSIIMHDWYWSILIEHIGKVIYVDKKLSFYRQHDDNLVGLNRSDHWLDKFKNVTKNLTAISCQRDYLHSNFSDKYKKPVILWFLIKNLLIKELISYSLVNILSLIYIRNHIQKLN